MLGSKGALPILTLGGIALPFVGTEIQHNRDPLQMLLYEAAFTVVGMGFCAFTAKKRLSISAAADIAGLWISMPLATVVTLHSAAFQWHWSWPNQSVWWVETPILCLLLTVWASDICGLLVGKAFGKHLLWPAVSPKKTIEGVVGGLAASLLASFVLWPFVHCVRPGPWFVAGPLLSGAGQLGDLFESWLKRTAGVKDSGSILPGHGGLLDRIDSLALAAPVAAMLVIFYKS